MPSRKALLAAVSACVVAALAGLSAAQSSSTHEDLVRLFHEWRVFQKPAIADGVPDYTPAAMEKQRRALPGWQKRLAAIDTKGWPIKDRVDWELVRAEMNGLDFDHRVLTPWSRNPCFYSVIVPEESDTPTKEGPAFAGALFTWRYQVPLSSADAATFRTTLRAIPRLLEQAKANLTGDARDLWLAAVHAQRQQAAELDALAARLAPHHPDLAEDAKKAKASVDAFRGWIESRLPEKKAASGVGVESYDWYMKNVWLVPYGWRDEVDLLKREHGRSLSSLALERNRNRALPELAPIGSEDEWKKRTDAAVAEYMAFLKKNEILTVTPDMEPALRAHVEPFTPVERLDFFGQVEARDPFMLRLHGFHWIDLARMKNRPHESPIRKGPLLYNIWAGRAEGNATAMEELMTTAGLLDTHPRSRELVDILVANRAARGLAGLLVHGRELTLEQAIRFAHDNTPNGWLKADGDLVWGEQQTYLEQPGYGSSYITGKAQIEKLLGDRAKQLGNAFTVKRFYDEMQDSGMIPVSLIAWEMTGDEAGVRALRR
jgi:uncharacterized protein (DUF885 family)